MAGRDRDERPQEAGDDGFLRRWSRRKAEVRRQQEPTATPEPGPPADTDAAEPQAIDPKDLPDIDSLTRESDFKVFMQKGVPAHLRTLALRKLWRLDPAFSRLDGLIEYGEDYTDSARVVAGFKTAYQVGKGFLKKIEGAEDVTPEDARTAATRIEAEATPPQIAADAGAQATPPQVTAEAAGAAPTEPSDEAEGASEHSERRTRPRPRPLPKRG